MKAVLRWGALVVSVGLTGVAGAGQAGAEGKKVADQKTEKRATPSPRRMPARIGPAKFKDLPKIADSRREALADKKRDEAIEGFKRLLPKIQDGTARKADLLYRLSELYWEKSKYLNQLEMGRFTEVEKRYDAAVARGEKLEPPKEDHAKSERYRAEVIGLYETLLKDYKDYEQRDEVLFSLGYNLMELGKRKEAVERYLELIQTNPRSKFVPDTYVQLGNHFFDANNLAKAREFFEKARASKVPKIYAYAVYKLAWCDYNAGDYEKALAKLHEVVDYADHQGRELGDLKTEALNDLTVFYVQLDQPAQGIAYFKAKAPPKRQGRLIAKIADGLAEAGHYDSAIKVYRTLIKDAPMGASAPEYQQAIVRAHEGLRQRSQVRTEMKRMVDLYRPSGEWWKANASQETVLRNAFNVTEEAMRVMVTEYHQEAQKTRQVETYRLARDIYKQYIDAFASSPDENFIADSAFNLHFFYAEILWALEEWAPAAEAYDAVVQFKIPKRDTAREVSDEKHRKRAAYAAVLAYDKLVKIERGQLAKSSLKDGEKVDEKKSKGDIESTGKLVKRQAKEVKEEPLSKLEGRLVAACDTYNRLFPDSPDEIDLRYQAAVILYDRGHFVEAARRFGEIITKFPAERRSQDAADLTMYVLETREEWLELNTLSRQFLKNAKLTKPGTDFAKRVASVVEGSQYKWVDEVIYKKDKNPARAAEEFLKYVAEFPRSENADRALTYAMIIFQDARQLDRGIEAGERVLDEYKGSPFELKVRYTLASFYEKLAEFRKAATMYESFVDAYDKAAGTSKGKRAAVAKKAADAERTQKDAERKQLVEEASKWVADALFNAGLWWEGVSEPQKAVAAYNAYLSRFKDRPDVAQIAMNVGLVYEKEKRWSEAAKAFAAFESTYGNDRRATGAQHFLARYRRMEALRNLKRTADAEREMAELSRGFAKLSAKDKQDPEVLDAYAHARFLEAEDLWRKYTDIRFSRVSTIRSDLAAKQREIQKVEKAYTGVLSTGSGEWGIAALTRIGLAYADFARNIMESPDPKGLDEEQLDMYRGELQNLAMPLEEKATEALDKALAKAYELSLYNEWTLAAQEQVNRYQPGAYSQVREVPYRGSEFFATSDIVKEATEAAAAKAEPSEPAPPAEPPAAAPPGAPKPTASLSGGAL